MSIFRFRSSQLDLLARVASADKRHIGLWAFCSLRHSQIWIMQYWVDMIIQRWRSWYFWSLFWANSIDAHLFGALLHHYFLRLITILNMLTFNRFKHRLTSFLRKHNHRVSLLLLRFLRYPSHISWILRQLGRAIMKSNLMRLHYSFRNSHWRNHVSL